VPIEKDDSFHPPRFPYHSIVVHIPLGAWTFSFLFDLLAWSGVGGNSMVRLSFFAIVIGLAVALIAIPTGVLDWGGVKREKPAWKLGLFHLVVTILFAINLGLRLPNWRDASEPEILPLILSAVGTVLLLISAWIGGRMIYEYGVGVARGSKEKWRRIAEKSEANVPAEES
jgi:uncharacterized membrane protein